MNERFEEHLKCIAIPEELTRRVEKGVCLAEEKKKSRTHFQKLLQIRNIIGFGQNRRLIITAASFLIIAAVLLTVFALPIRWGVAADLITATKSDVNGVDITTDFIIRSPRFKTAEELKKNLKLNTNESYRLKKQSGGTYQLTFESPLKPNKIYSFEIAGSQDIQSFAFQTKQDFMVNHTLPANNSKGVPVDTGIEITFTMVNFSGYEKFIEIMPKTEGRFEKYGSTVVFVPNSLTPNTNYCVTVKKGVRSDGGEVTKEDYTFQFRTASENETMSYVNLSGDRSETFLSTDIPVIELDAGGDYLTNEYTAGIYSVDDPKAYARLLSDTVKDLEDYHYNRTFYNIVDTQTYHKVSEFRTTPVLGGSSFQSSGYLVLPKVLPVGYYIVNIACGEDVMLQKFIQINDTAVYAMSNNGSVLIWANDTKTGKPMAGTEVFADDVKKGTTAADGTLRFTAEKDTEKGTVIIGNGKNPFVTCLPLMEKEQDRPLYQQYYSYLYTDREGYLSTDKIKIFGFLKPKENQALPQKADVYLFPQSYTGNDSYDENGNPQYDLSKSLLSSQITIGDNGIFSTELDIKNFSSSSYRLILGANNELITSKSVSVENYTKPLYQINFEKGPDVFFVGESTTIKANVSYYDGTPVANMPFTIQSQNNTEATQNTDGSGNLSQDIVIRDSSGESWRPDRVNIGIQSAGVDDEIIYESKHILVLPKTVMLETKLNTDTGKPIVEIATHKITKDKLTLPNYDYGNVADTIRGKAVDTDVSVRIVKVTIIPYVTESYYDYIEKRRVDCYDYTKRYDLVSEKTIKTKNGLASVKDLPLSTEENTFYYCSVSCSDTNGKLVS